MLISLLILVETSKFLVFFQKFPLYFSGIIQYNLRYEVSFCNIFMIILSYKRFHFSKLSCSIVYLARRVELLIIFLIILSPPRKTRGKGGIFYEVSYSS